MEYILFIVLGLVLVFVFYLAVNTKGSDVEIGDMLEVDSSDEIEDSNVLDNKIDSLDEIIGDVSESVEYIDENGVSRFRARRGMEEKAISNVNTNFNQNSNPSNQDVI